MMPSSPARGQPEPRAPQRAADSRAGRRQGGKTLLRGWRSTVEIVLFDISNSMKPYPPVFHAYTSKWRPVTGFFEPQAFDYISNRIPPTSHLWLPAEVHALRRTLGVRARSVTVATVLSMSGFGGKLNSHASDMHACAGSTNDMQRMPW